MLTKTVETFHLESRLYEMLIVDLDNTRPALRSFSEESWSVINEVVEFEKVPDVVDDYMVSLLNKH